MYVCDSVLLWLTESESGSESVCYRCCCCCSVGMKKRKRDVLCSCCGCCLQRGVVVVAVCV